MPLALGVDVALVLMVPHATNASRKVESRRGVDVALVLMVPHATNASRKVHDEQNNTRQRHSSRPR
jgi:hypothetical protein